MTPSPGLDVGESRPALVGRNVAPPLDATVGTAEELAGPIVDGVGVDPSVAARVVGPGVGRLLVSGTVGPMMGLAVGLSAGGTEEPAGLAVGRPLVSGIVGPLMGLAVGLSVGVLTVLAGSRAEGVGLSVAAPVVGLIFGRRLLLFVSVAVGPVDGYAIGLSVEVAGVLTGPAVTGAVDGASIDSLVVGPVVGRSI